MRTAKVNFDFSSLTTDNQYSVTAKVTPARPAPAQNDARFQDEDEQLTVTVVCIVDKTGREVYESDLSPADRHEIERTAAEHFNDDLFTI